MALMPRTLTKPGPAAKSLDERRWQAVVARDKAADGTFYTAVATTGIYCRPSCSARQPLRKNVSFYSTSAEAVAAGYRACKRCKPDAPADAVAYDPNAAKVTAACRMIEAAETPPRLDTLARVAGMSPHHFHRVFKALTGVTPRAYAAAHRQQRVRAALSAEGSVTEAMYTAGYNSSSRFYAEASQALGMKPRSYRAGGADVVIRHAVAGSSLGPVLVAATDKGICAIFFGDDREALQRELSRRFPRASLQSADKPFAKLISAVVAHIEAPAKAFDLPLDIRGTAFQHQVWEALREIPPGETVTYGDIARRIGKPAAVRAVGTACGANPIAVAVPCHRVVGSNGALTGYRWGVERKRKLLEREKRKPRD